MEPKIKALLNQINSGKMPSDKAKILDFIIKRPGKNKLLICGYLKMPHQTVTARLSDLEDIGAIESKSDGTYSNFYFISDPAKQKVYAEYRKQIKIEQWVNKGFSLDLPKEVMDPIKNYLNSPSYVENR